jgi:hypothetical protein
MGQNTQLLYRDDEVLTDFKIGEFNDRRLACTGALLFKRMCEKLTVCVKSLANNRALEVSFGRFLGNKKVTSDTICKGLAWGGENHLNIRQ